MSIGAPKGPFGGIDVNSLWGTRASGTQAVPTLPRRQPLIIVDGKLPATSTALNRTEAENGRIWCEDSLRTFDSCLGTTRLHAEVLLLGLHDLAGADSRLAVHKPVKVAVFGFIGRRRMVVPTERNCIG